MGNKDKCWGEINRGGGGSMLLTVDVKRSAYLPVIAKVKGCDLFDIWLGLELTLWLGGTDNIRSCPLECQ